ncbi:MAG: YciI family protein [Ferruginibacter sp.]
MKFICFLLLLVSGFSTYAQKANPNYDSTLAKKYGGDDYGMKMYVFVILKTGSNTTTDKALTDSLFAGHMSNINHMVSINKLLVAGPMVKNDKTYRGIFILDVKSFEEAEKLLEKDPAIKEKLLAVEMYNWYGSAALPAYIETSDKVTKLNF